MSEGNILPDLSPDAGMKNVPVMVHTQNYLAWGNIQISENLSANLVLQGTTIPDFIALSNAQVLAVEKGLGGEPTAYAELNLPTHSILAFHSTPPHTEPADYDPNEPNRKMEPVTARVGNFIFNGRARMSTQTNLKSFLEVTRADFVSIYNLEIVHRLGGNQPTINVDAAQIRRLNAIWASTS